MTIGIALLKTCHNPTGDECIILEFQLYFLVVSGRVKKLETLGGFPTFSRYITLL